MNDLIQECYDKGVFDECNQNFDFQKYVKNNPKIVELFFKYTIQAVNSGSQKISSELIVNRIRWQISIVAKQEDKYKINNNAKSFLSRLFVYSLPQYKGVFNTRTTNKGGKDEQY